MTCTWRHGSWRKHNIGTLDLPGRNPTHGPGVPSGCKIMRVLASVQPATGDISKRLPSVRVFLNRPALVAGKFEAALHANIRDTQDPASQPWVNDGSGSVGQAGIASMITVAVATGQSSDMERWRRG